MSRQWQFVQDAQGQWRWKRIDDLLGEVDSEDSFATEVDCMMDAVRFAVGRRRPLVNPNDRVQ